MADGNIESAMRREVIERTFCRDFDRRLPVPHDLFELAQHDPMIAAYINAWRHGDCSWEAALISLVVAQHHDKQKLLQDAMVILDHSKMPFIIPGVGNWTNNEGGGEGEEEARRAIKQRGMTLLAQHGRTLVVASHPAFLCERWYKWIIVAVNHEKLAELIIEGKRPLNRG